MYVVAQSVIFPSVSNSPQKNQNVIQATLLFDLPSQNRKKPVEVIKEETPEPIEPEEDLAVEEKLVDSEIEPISEPEAQAPPISLPVKLEEVQETSEENNAQNKIMMTEQNIVPTPGSEMRTLATNMARRHLSSFQQQQQHRVAEQAYRYYQQHKNSPIMDNEVKNPFMTKNEELIGSLKIRADCSSTSKKTTAVILGFLGGQIDCSKPPTIEGFIQNRINKRSYFSGQNRKQEKKRPQSVVIKEQP